MKFSIISLLCVLYLFSMFFLWYFTFYSMPYYIVYFVSNLYALLYALLLDLLYVIPYCMLYLVFIPYSITYCIFISSIISSYSILLYLEYYGHSQIIQPFILHINICILHCTTSVALDAILLFAILIDYNSF